jgi:type IV pilus assembly protein PilN
LRARQKAVEDLQGDRNLPVHLLNELVNQLPDGIYLSSSKQVNQSVLLTGVAQSQERVSELLRNLSNNSPALSKPDLIEIVASNVAVTNREQRRVFNFTIRVSLNRPSVAATGAGTASSTVAEPVPGKV